MRIKKLDINQFGSFEKRSIRFPDSPFVIVYGENEAGKSTLMHYLLCVLFGFPQRSTWIKWGRDCSEERFGGAVTFETSDREIYRMERLYSNGNTPSLRDISGNDISVAEFFAHFDRYLYENVFCFDLDGLQGIERFRPEQLNNLLLGAGMLGNQTVSDLEQTLDKKMNALFKKGGKIPDINNLFHELDSTEKELKKWEEKLDAFQELQEKIKKDRKTLVTLASDKKAEMKCYEKWKIYSRLIPLWASNRALSEELEKMMGLPDLSSECLEQHRALCDKIQSLEEDLAALREEKSLLEEQLNAVRHQPIWCNNESRIVALSRAAIIDEQNQIALGQLKNDQQHATSEYSVLMARLGKGWTPERIEVASIDLSFQKELSHRMASWKEKKSEKENAQSEIQMQHERMRQMKEKMDVLQQDRYTETSDRRQNLSANHSFKSAIIMPLAVVSVILALVAGVILGIAAALFTLATGLLCMFLAVFVAGKKRPFMDANTAAFAQQRQVERAMLADQLDLAQRTLTRLAQQQEKAEQEQLQQTRNLSDWLHVHGYPATDDFESMPALVALLIESRKAIDQLRGLQTEAEERRAEHQNFLQTQDKLARDLGVSGADVRSMEQRLKKEKEAENKRLARANQLDFYIKKITLGEERLQKLMEEKARQLKQAGVASSEALNERAKQVNRREELLDKQGRQQLQMYEIAGGEASFHAWIDDLKSAKWDSFSKEEFSSRLTALEQEEDTLRERLIQEESTLKSLESGDSYRETKDRFAALQTELKNKADKWCAYQTARWAIHEVKNKYRLERMPQVLERAGHYLEAITCGTYHKLELTDSDGFIACRQDGHRFFASELSRGTAEQVYLSLRFALTDMYRFGQEHLPIIVDEGFVNFDEQRAEQTYQVLSRLSAQRQIILFTCHYSDYLDQHPQSVLALSEIKRRVL
ncbi:AAA family ATPase [Sporolactobacillus spathodeae]